MSSDAHGAAVPQVPGLKHPYHLPDPSPWPIIGAIGGFLTVFGIIIAAHYGNYMILTELKGELGMMGLPCRGGFPGRKSVGLV